MLTCVFNDQGVCKCGSVCPSGVDRKLHLQQCCLFKNELPKKPEGFRIPYRQIFRGRLGTRIANFLKWIGIKQISSCGCANRERSLNYFSGWIVYQFKNIFFPSVPHRIRHQLDRQLAEAEKRDRLYETPSPQPDHRKCDIRTENV